MFSVGQKSPGKIKHLNCENIQITFTVKVTKKFALLSSSISHFLIVLFHELFLSLEFKNKKF